MLTFLVIPLLFTVVNADYPEWDRAPICQCLVTGTISCTNLPSDNNVIVRDLAFGMKEFEIPFTGQVFRQIDLASYLFYSHRIPAHLTRIRHPYVLTANSNSMANSITWEIEWAKSYEFFIQVGELGKPRTRAEAKWRRKLGFRRDMMCYSSATGDEMARLIQSFNARGLGYHTFTNNCEDFSVHLIEGLCGPEVAQRAKWILSNAIMKAGRAVTVWEQTPRPQFPVVFYPAASHAGNDLRRQIDSDGIANIYEGNF